MKNHFPNIIGQNKAKSQLGFFIESYNHGVQLNPMFFQGPFGSGKTELARTFAKKLSGKADFVEVNASVIKNVDEFFKYMIRDVINKFVVFFIDEAHLLAKDIQNLLLTIFNTNKEPVRYIRHGFLEYPFDLRQNIFLLATTDPQKVVQPLRSRCEIIDLETYSAEEMAEILKLLNPKITFTLEALGYLAYACRGIPREAVLLSQKLTTFCSVNKINLLDIEDVYKLCDICNIKMYGIRQAEERILKILTQETCCKFSILAAKTQIPKAALFDAENYLLRIGAIAIENSVRYITQDGKNICDSLSSIR